MLLTIGHIEENGPIGLTPTKALKRYFVTSAAGAFDWPAYTVEDLYAVNKVLNEHDFPPLMEVLLSVKLARHFKLTANLYVHVLRPLYWAGLLNEHRTGTGFSRRDFYTKTPLWPAALKLETNRHLLPATHH